MGPSIVIDRRRASLQHKADPSASRRDRHCPLARSTGRTGVTSAYPRDVLVLSLCPLSTMGGGETFTMNVSLSARAAGDHVHVAAPVALPPMQASFAERMAWPMLALHGDGRSAPVPTTWCRLLEEMGRYDVIAVEQFLASDMVFDVVAAADGTQRVIFTSLGYEPLLDLFTVFYQPAPNHRVLSISQFAADRLSRRGLPSEHAYAGVWASEIQPPVAGASRPARFSLVGRVLPHKGYEVAIDALTADEQIVHVGQPGLPEYRAFLNRRAAGKQVAFEGILDESGRRGAVRSTRALIACSRDVLHDGVRIEQAELFGLVVLEAVASGVLPVTSDIPPFVEVMDGMSLSEWVYPQGRSDALRVLLDRVKVMPQAEYVATVRRAQQAVRERFTWEGYWRRACEECERTAA